jgi:hypothetical protein
VRAVGVRSVELDVHGLRVSANGDWPEVLRSLALDFAWFETPGGGPAGATLRIRRGAPDWDRHAAARPAFVTPRNMVLADGDRTLIDYFGRALSVYDRATGHVTIQGEDAALVHEAAYHFVVSRIGEHLDRIGLVRLHALGLAGASGGVAIMLPSGGGKSTLGLRALRDPAVRLLSDDSPLLDRRGRLHAFPLRIGINATDAARLPEGHVRRIDRMEHHPKLAIELSAFRDRIEPRPQPLRHLVLGRRTLGRTATLEPLGRAAALAPLLRESVVGVGLYQGMEFVLQRGLRDVFAQAGPGLVRARGCAAGLARAQVWRLTTGRDHEANWAALEPLLR